MNKEVIEKYRIRDYYMIPVEVVDNIFYSFEQENEELKRQLDKYENPEEMDKLKETLKEYADYAIKLVNENKRLQKELNQKNKIIEEAIEYCKENQFGYFGNQYDLDEDCSLTQVLAKIEELEKGSEE